MKLALLSFALVMVALALPTSAAEATGPLDFKMNSLDGKPVDLSKYKGDVVLIVNVASKCGFTPQYEGLEKLWRDYGDRGLVVLGFPCDQFGHQEPGDADEIRNFCSLTYDVTFPMFAKIEVNGAGADPLWQWLKKQKGGLLGIDAIKWNFTKFLIGKDGQLVKRFAPVTKPQDLTREIEALLK